MSKTIFCKQIESNRSRINLLEAIVAELQLEREIRTPLPGEGWLSSLSFEGWRPYNNYNNNRNEKCEVYIFEKSGKAANFEKVRNASLFVDAQTAILKESRAMEGATS